MRTLLIACFVVALTLFYSVSGQCQDANPSAISARIAEITPPDKDIPDNQIILADEIRRVNQELEETRKLANTYDKEIKSLNQNKELAAKTLQEIANLNCESPPPNLSLLMDQVDRLTRSLSNPWDDDYVSDPWVSVTTQDIRKLAGKEQCEGLKKVTSDPDLSTFIERKQNELEAIKAETGRLLEALQKRQAALSLHNDVAETKQDIFQYLWIIIGVIGLLSIGTIFVIKLFTPDLQQQWVASGQVIQFVTVMILLSVIMALGLASILKENTLGTLLGGIAGYVLSQGVGRAAAQAVKEGILKGTSAATSAPVIAVVTPKTGPSTGGTTVSITGTGFDSVMSVMFGATPAIITGLSSTAIEVTTTAGQEGVVDVIVNTRDGHTVTSTNSFTFT
jgi:hypothetical protein